MAEPVSLRPGASIRLSGLTKQFGARTVLDGIELEIRPGELLGIVGPSGSGKSTLLRILSGLEQPSAGELRVLGDAGDARGDVRVVFQEPRLLPWRSVLDNVCLGLPRDQLPKGRAVLERVGLGERLSDYPATLSGGQRQRVALARALVREPRVLLLDEPFAALDALTRIAAQRLVEALWLRAGFTAVLVTHDVQEAVMLADRVLLLDEGRVQRCVAVDLPRPRARHSPEAARISGQLLDAILGSSLSGQSWLETPSQRRQRRSAP
jgi:sulfonate transport system ATP-binding protein